MPCTEKKVSSVFFCLGLHVLPLPTNFSPACFGCQNKVVDGFMCLEIFEKSIWTASGEPLARSFDKKMVLAPKPTISFFDHNFRRSILECFWRGGAVEINKNHEN